MFLRSSTKIPCASRKMALLSKPKAVKTTIDGNNDRDVDRISALPDALICHILSFLPTKYAVLTALLSTRWRYLFISVPDIDIDLSVPDIDDDISDPDGDFDTSLIFKSEEIYEKVLSDYMTFGFRLLLLRNGAPIRKLRLTLWRLPESAIMAVDAFISTALLCHVQHICFTVQQWEPFRHRRLLPLGTFTCKTLVVLHLYREVDLRIPSAVSLPNLKVLYLDGLILVDEGSVPRLIKHCPLLEELYLRLGDSHNGDNVDNVRAVHVSSASLRKLILKCQRSEYALVFDVISLKILDYFVYGEHKIIMNAPNLEYFAFNSDSDCKFDITNAYDLKYWIRGDHGGGLNFMHNLKSLVKAKIRAEYEVAAEGRSICGEEAYELVYGLQSVKSLCLSENFLEVFHYSQSCLPNFTNLITLELEAGRFWHADYICMWKSLPRLLNSSPNLEVLVLDEVFWFETGERIEEFEHLFIEALPVHFIERLREIEIIKLSTCEEYEVKLVEYFLQNGKSLRKMTLGIYSQEACHKRRIILSLKRCSLDCQIVFKRRHQGCKDCL